MGVELITNEDFQKFKMELIEEIKVMIKEISNKNDIPWIKSSIVKEELSISHGKLQNLRNKGILPYSDIDGTFFYSIEDINRVFEKNKIDKKKIRKGQNLTS